MLAERTTSPSPSRRTLGDKISALGAKLSRTLNHVDENKQHEDGDDASSSPILHKTDRSVSRGREAFQSTGRGGIGNIRQASLSRDGRPASGPDDFSPTRGREPVANPQAIFSTGRGGAGNLRSPSRDTSKARPDPVEENVIREYAAAHENAPFSSGRGGIGNITRSRSRDPSILAHPAHSAPHVHSTGRGGAGNIVPGNGLKAEVQDDQERRQHSTSREGIHSTGRGGTANLTHEHVPPVETHLAHHAEYESHGRGGLGNIVHDTKTHA